MAEAAAIRGAREKVREQERAIWTAVERVGRDLRTDPFRQAVTQAESDATGKPKLKEGFGV